MPGEVLFTNYPRLVALAGFTECSQGWTHSYRCRLPPGLAATIFDPSCSTEGVNRWRLLAEWDVAPEGSASSVGPPGASGDTARPNYVGPSGNGLVEADERG